MENLMTMSSRDITANMVTVPFEQQQQLAFRSWMNFRLERAQEWDVEP